MPINDQFVFTDPVAGQQRTELAKLAAAEKEAQNRNIAQMLESQSRERSARYVTQAQMAQQDKELAVRADDLKYKREILDANLKLDKDATRDAAAKSRAKLQFDTVIEKLRNNQADPPTKRELEAILQMGPDLTEDQKNAARSLREDVYKAAKSAAMAGEQSAKNYMAELKGKTANDPSLARIHERLQKDPNVVFDLSTGQVHSRFQMPREDADAGGVPTIDDMKAKAKGFSTAPPGGGVPPRASELAGPPRVGSFMGVPVPVASPAGTPAPVVSSGGSPFATPGTLLSLLLSRMVPQSQAGYGGDMGNVPRGADLAAPMEMMGTDIPPRRVTLPPPQYPRVADLQQNIRPEYAPVPEGLYQ